jgi:hypothetical protein
MGDQVQNRGGRGEASRTIGEIDEEEVSAAVWSMGEDERM